MLFALFGVFRLFLQFGVTLPARPLQAAIRERGAHRAARLALVAAIAETTLPRQLLDLLERLAQVVAARRQLQFPHAGIVHNQAAVGRKNQLPARRRVQPFMNMLADRIHALALLPKQRVDDGGFSDAR